MRKFTQDKNTTIMKNKILIFLVLAISIIACDDSENNENKEIKEIVNHPINIGSKWIYERELIIQHFNGQDTSKIEKIDTFNSVIRVWIEKDTTLNDTLHVKILKTQIDGDSYISEEFISLDSEGLKCYAYRNAAINLFAMKGIHEGKIMSYNDGIISDNEIFYEPTTRIILKFPIRIDSKWTSIYSKKPSAWSIDKEVIGKENLNIGKNSYSCFKISWKYNSETMFKGLSIYDWISEKGLIKRKLINKKVALTNELNEVIKCTQTTEQYILKDIIIN